MVLVGTTFSPCMRLVLMSDMGGGALRSSAEMHNPKDTVAQEKHPYKEERCELRPRRSDEVRSADDEALHQTHILYRLP